jgi:soluble cytochrome b562
MGRSHAHNHCVCVTWKQYVDTLREADRQAEAVKEQAALRALALQAETQKYKDEKANDLRSQIERERGNYVNQDQHQALIGKIDDALKPLQEFMVSQIASGAGIRTYQSDARDERVSQYNSVTRANLALAVATIATLGSLVSIIVLLISGK